MRLSINILYIYISLISLSFAVHTSNKLKNTKSKVKIPILLQTTKANDPYEIYDSQEIFYADGPCSINNCDNCITSNRCQCPSGYAHLPSKTVKENEKSCGYKRKHQALFFTLELLLPFGIGHFYAGRIIYGIIKLCIFILLIGLDFSIKRSLKSFYSKQNFNFAIIFAYFCYLIWQLSDLVCIGLNIFNDGKLIKLLTFASK